MKKGSEVLYLATIFAGGNGDNGVRYASATVLWPFIPAFEEEYKKFLLEDGKIQEAKLEAAAKAAAELRTKLEAEARVSAEKIIADARIEAERILSEAKAAAAAIAKRTTIVCIKGKVTKKVTAIKPKCPAGYKKK
jgi:F0F1-type ATP synthase membrane subunit b/b'